MKRGSRSHKSQYFPSKRGMKITFTLSTTLALTLMSSAIARNVNLFDGNDNQPIVGGTEATPGRYSYTVALSASGFQFCGGSLIAPDTVLTAAHCMKGSSFDVVINRHDLSTTDGEVTPRRLEIKHPGYNDFTMENDFALVFLNRGTTENVDFVMLNQDDSYPSAGSTSRAMGWGDTSSGGSSSNVLRQVDLPVITNEQCAQQYPQETIFANNICTFLPGKDTCQGDSGGPLIMPGVDASADVLIGLTSWGYGCASQQYPGVYARVSDQIEWIKTIVCNESSFPPRDLCESHGTSSPTTKPTPTSAPGTQSPTQSPVTVAPTHKPSQNPTRAPSRSPTTKPTAATTQNPTSKSPTTLSPTNEPVTSNPTTESTSSCYPRASSIKIESTTGQHIHIFDFKALSSGLDVALGGSAQQSSTFRNRTRFEASSAIDGDLSTFCHTQDDNPWWQVDLRVAMSEVTSIEIKNRNCSSGNCLCRLSDANLVLLDDLGSVVSELTLGNTCGKFDLIYEMDKTFSCSSVTPSPTPHAEASLPKAQFVKLHSITGMPIHIKEIEVYTAAGVNVALGKTASQSSTLNQFVATRAVDGSMKSFSHTKDPSPTLQIDLGTEFEIYSVKIVNRYCKSPADPNGCLCRLSHAILSLFDGQGWVSTTAIGNTCGQLEWTREFSDYDSSACTDWV